MRRPIAVAAVVAMILVAVVSTRTIQQRLCDDKVRSIHSHIVVGMAGADAESALERLGVCAIDRWSAHRDLPARDAHRSRQTNTTDCHRHRMIGRDRQRCLNNSLCGDTREGLIFATPTWRSADHDQPRIGTATRNMPRSSSRRTGIAGVLRSEKSDSHVAHFG